MTPERQKLLSRLSGNSATFSRRRTLNRSPPTGPTAPPAVKRARRLVQRVDSGSGIRFFDLTSDDQDDDFVEVLNAEMQLLSGSQVLICKSSLFLTNEYH